jgi:hypothetical protein
MEIRYNANQVVMARIKKRFEANKAFIVTKSRIFQGNYDKS